MSHLAVWPGRAVCASDSNLLDVQKQNRPARDARELRVVSRCYDDVVNSVECLVVPILVPVVPNCT